MLAHQGGWDETAFVLVPLLIFFVLLRIAKRRAASEEDARPSADE